MVVVNFVKIYVNFAKMLHKSRKNSTGVPEGARRSFFRNSSSA